jgi:asparagine synthase (glutamine-hydrolysing)
MLEEEIIKPVCLKLKRNLGWAWFHNQYDGKVIHCKGYFVDRDGNSYHGSSICNYFDGAVDEASFVAMLDQVNGFFAIVVEYENTVLVAVDRLRSMPLFYASTESGIIIGDDASDVADGLSHVSIDTVSAEEFVFTGFVLGRNTLNPSVKEIQAGEYLYISDNKIRPMTYYLHTHGDYLSCNEAAHFKALAEISRRVCQRLVESVGERPILLPLSGGYDSRYLACMLKETGFKNVICYTYGRKDSFEVDVSRKVANRLGYEWHFVEYTEEKITTMFSSEGYQAYSDFCHNLSSLPHVQEYIALHELKTKNILPLDAVVVPGFCGDLLGGSYVPILSQVNRTEELIDGDLTKYIADGHLNLRLFTGDSVGPHVLAHIDDILKDMGANTHTEEAFISFNEAFFTRHKVAKFVVNSLRVYEFFDLEWRMPLWDNELIEYWYKIPVESRIGDTLYDRFLFHHYFDSMDVTYKKSPIKTLEIHRLMRRMCLPWSMAKTLEKWMKQVQYLMNKNQPHFNAFDVFEKLILRELSGAGMGKTSITSINALYTRWWLLKKYGWQSALQPIRSK